MNYPENFSKKSGFKLLEIQEFFYSMVRMIRFYRYFLFLGMGLLSVQAVVDFEKEVWPILEKRCVECHQAAYEQAGRMKNPKAGLRLDGAAHIMLGSDDGPVIKVDHPSKSSLYTRVMLPFDDDEHMPPKGNPLSRKQKEILRKWIAQGVDFGTWIGATDGIEELIEKRKEKKYVPEHITFFQSLAGDLSPLAPKMIERLAAETGLLIRPLGIGNSLLEVRMVSSGVEVDESTLETLMPLRDHLAKLDLSGTDLSKQSCSLIRKFSRLTHLNVRQSTMDDSGLKALSGLKNLISLNLSETKVSDYGIKPLLSFQNLKSLHLWKSEVSDSRRQFLKNRLPGVVVTP